MKDNIKIEEETIKKFLEILGSTSTSYMFTEEIIYYLLKLIQEQKKSE